MTINISEREYKVLGFSFYRSKDGVRVRIHPKSITKMRAKVKVLTGRTKCPIVEQSSKIEHRLLDEVYENRTIIVLLIKNIFHIVQ